MKIPAILTKWFPAPRYEVTEEFNSKSARAIVVSGTYKPIMLGNSGYTKLWQGPEGSKVRVIVCKNELLGDLLNAE